MNKFFSPLPLWQKEGLAIVRIITGLLLIYHGWDVFEAGKMKEYAAWEAFKNNPSPAFMVYTGKLAELAAGFFLLVGWFTRITAIVIILTFLYIPFFIGSGKIWYEDQHPFLFVLLGLVFFFTGPGTLSLDQLIYTRNQQKTPK